MIGQKLRQFRLDERIGSGAMGIVFLAWDETKNRRAAVKVITAEQSVKANATPRFIREAEILQGLKHPNIVRFLGGGRFQGTLYIAMEFVPGGTVDDLLAKREFLPWQEVVEFGAQIAGALQCAHDKGIVHRDLKPSNLLISETGQIKLTDFGIAKDLDATALTADGRTLGTAAYMSPEQIRENREVGHKTDLYALGCVMYQMLTGSPPFMGKTPVALMNAHLTEPVPRPSAKAPQIPRALDDLIVALMAKDPRERPHDALAVEHILNGLRERRRKGEKIAMVFPGGSAPARFGEVSQDLPPTHAATGSRRTDRAARRQAREAWPPPPFYLRRGVIETAGLGAAAVLLAAVIAYFLWPPSAGYLHGQAARLMASPQSTDWSIAREHYINELRRRFPEYRKADVQAWYDKIALELVTRRAKVLEAPNLGALSQPKTKGEKLFVSVFNEAYADSKAGSDTEAARRWHDMIGVLDPNDPEERPWVLLAGMREAAVRKDIEERRKVVAAMLDRADKLDSEGDAPAAARLRADAVRRYGDRRELADLLARRAGGKDQAPPAAKDATKAPD